MDSHCFTRSPVQNRLRSCLILSQNNGVVSEFEVNDRTVVVELCSSKVIGARLIIYSMAYLNKAMCEKTFLAAPGDSSP